MSEMINVSGDGDVFMRFVWFSSEGAVNLAERPPQAERSQDHQVCTQCCICSLGPFQSLCPYDLKTGLPRKLSVSEGKHCKESSGFPMSWYEVVNKDPDGWDQFIDGYSLRKPGLSSGGADVVGEGLRGSGSSS